MKIGTPIPRRRCRIEIIPLIDIMFFLLAAFMMVSLNMSKLNAVRIDTPRALSGEKDIKADVFNISINRQGQLYLGEELVTLEALGQSLSNRFARARADIPVYISGDRDTAHGVVLSVLDLVRRAGVQRVSFAVTPPAD
jgi:biopolymer transport protein ExbD